MFMFTYDCCACSMYMWVVYKGRFNTLSHHILICHHHLLCYDKCIFPVAGPACNVCNAILLILHNHQQIRELTCCVHQASQYLLWF